MGNLFGLRIVNQIKEICREIEQLDDDSKIETLNEIRWLLHEVSPMRNEPVDCVLWVRGEIVEANDYNPNAVAPPEMKLLKVSVDEDGVTQPVVTWVIDNHREVVDGFHRTRVIKEYPSISKRLFGYVPVTTINEWRGDKSDRIAATIRHNRARGRHQIEKMSDIVMELHRRNWSDEKIARELGMEPDEVLRLKQITGLAEMFTNREFSEAWEVSDVE